MAAEVMARASLLQHASSTASGSGGGARDPVRTNAALPPGLCLWLCALSPAVACCHQAAGAAPATGTNNAALPPGRGSLFLSLPPDSCCGACDCLLLVRQRMFALRSCSAWSG